ncbi:hypothetical protein RDI58_029304 [Solanum bulbocastanum]|uniref:Uncharacterized protein n=1 Tax=Solanum bulbocastanum TaxID=147425 RepID=A0AAN8SRL1_SOLBU
MAKQVLKNQYQAFSSRFIPNAIQVHNYYEFSVAWLPICPQWRTLGKILNTNILSPNNLDANQHLRSQKVIGRDFTFWDDPLVFKLERFWSSDLDMRGQDFELIPFGAPAFH